MNSSLAWTAVLGRRDQPTDALEDYCRCLAEALSRRGCLLRLLRVAWDEHGWKHALETAERHIMGSRPQWLLVQYTALSWSKRGFPTGFLRLVRRLKRMDTKVAIVFHDPLPFPGARLRDVLRRRVQVWAMSRSAELADKVISTVHPQRIPWMKRPAIRPRTVLIPVGSNFPARNADAPPGASHVPTVVVLGVTEGKQEEAAFLAATVCHAEQQAGPLRLVVVGRGAESAGPVLRRCLAESRVELEIHGVLPAGQVSDLLVCADAQLFLRSGLSSRRGSAIAGVACGLPVVGYADAESDFPITEAGVHLAPTRDAEMLGRELAHILTDRQWRESLRQKSLDATRKYFAWDAVASQYLSALCAIESGG